MGSLTVNVGSGGQMRLDVFVISQNQAGNYTTVGVRGYLINTTSVRSFKNDAAPMNIYGTQSWDSPSGFNVAAHSEQLVIAADFNVGHDANGYGSSSFGFHMGATGTVTFGGGGDAAPVNDTFPRIPKPPSPPTPAVVWVETRRAGIAVSVAGDENGASADLVNYRVYRVWDGAHMGDMTGGYGGVAFGPLDRYTDYHAYAQTHNIAGWGDFGGPIPFRTLADPPSPPPTGADTITPVSARIVVYPSADGGGPGIDAYEAYVMTNNAWPDGGGNIVASASGGTFTATGLIPSTQYFYTARARNTSGIWSGWTVMQAFTTLPSANVKTGGVYKNALPYVKQGGVYKMAIPYKKLGGVYRQ